MSPTRRPTPGGELRAVQDDLAGDRGEAARVREDETWGYGSSATWKGGRS